MSDDVMRYNQCDRYLSEGGGEMEQDEQGDWVLYSDLEAQLAQRDAALKAADDLAHETERRINDLGGYDGRFPVRQALTAYRNARGQDED